jgi:cytochrome c peroxidase
MLASMRILVITLGIGCFVTIAFVPLLQSSGEMPAHAENRSSVAQRENFDQEPIQPLPLTVDLNADKVSLGQKLFHDPRLSADNSISCAHCHDLRRGGMDGLVHSRGIFNTEGGINAPTVFNVGLNFKLFTDGRAATLEDQIDGPIQNPAEMGSSWPAIVGKLSQDRPLVETFRQIYPDGVQSKNIKDALATFERSLITPNCRFDRYLRGESSALTEQEKEGYRLFKSYGCVSCHQGAAVGANMYARLGVMNDYFADRGTPLTRADLGRFNVTGRESDRYRFKVPGLRNVAQTAPYFHDGSARTLAKAIEVMGEYQLGRRMSRADVESIAQFLRTLTGEYEGKGL